jgi:hypothetical protein
METNSKKAFDESLNHLKRLIDGLDHTLIDEDSIELKLAYKHKQEERSAIEPQIIIKSCNKKGCS